MPANGSLPARGTAGTEDPLAGEETRWDCAGALGMGGQAPKGSPAHARELPVSSMACTIAQACTRCHEHHICDAADGSILRRMTDLVGMLQQICTC